MKNRVGYVIICVMAIVGHGICKAGSNDTDDQMILNELVKNIFKVKNNDPVYSLFKDSTNQYNDLMGSLEKIGPVVARMGEGKLDDHFKKIQLALGQYFSTINDIRAYIKNSINTGSSEWLNNGTDARDTRINMKHDFEKLDKKKIDSFISKLTMAQKEMNNKFGLLSKPVFKSASYKVCYDALKKIAQMVNELIKDLISGEAWSTLPELFNLIKAKSGSSFSFFNKKPTTVKPRDNYGYYEENGKLHYLR